MKRIDFLGAPGVGKSTTYKALVNNRRKKDSWLTPKEAKNKIAYEFFKKDAYSKKKLLTLYNFKHSLFKRKYNRSINRIITEQQKDIFWEKQNEYKDFLEIALKGVSIKEKEPLRRILGINWFYIIFSDVIFIENSNLPEIVVFDESLSQKVYGITHNCKGFFENTIKDYFRNIPLPQALIYCKLDPKETFNRIKNRRKIIPGHRQLESDQLNNNIKVQLEIAERGADILKNRNVGVLEIDLNDSLEFNIEIISNFLKLQ